MKLSAAITLFLGEYRPTTARSYRPVLLDMQRYLGEARRVGELQPHHLIEYRQTIGQRGYALATIDKYVKTAKAFFNWLVRVQLLDKSPAGAMKSVRLPMAIDRAKAMTDEELAQVLDYTKWMPRQDALVRFIADTACRRGGAAGLRVRDIDFDTREANVTEKGGKTRKVVFGETTKKALLIWLLKCPRGAEDSVFSTEGQRISPEVLGQLFRRCCEKAGVEPRGPHCLRIRKGFQFSDEGISVTTAATALGHSDPIITMRHYYPHDWETARTALEALAIPETQPKIIQLRRVK